MPPGLEQLTRLEGLWIVTQMPLRLPASLGQSLQGLHGLGRAFGKKTATCSAGTGCSTTPNCAAYACRWARGCLGW